MIVLGADHNGKKLAVILQTFLRKQGKECALAIVPNEGSQDDYPMIASIVAQTVLAKKGSVGLLVCGSGNGMVMAANRFRGIRAALVPTVAFAKKARSDENANVLVLPAWWVTVAEAKNIVSIWLKTPFAKKARYIRRIRQLDTLGRG